MKPKFLILALFMLSVCSVFAQDMVIKSLRSIIDDAPSQFNNLQKDFLEEKSKNGYTYYSSNADQSFLSESYIRRKENEQPMYIVIYKVPNTDPTSFRVFKEIYQAYMNEMEEMAKSGNYVVRDATEYEQHAIQLTNLNNDEVLQYLSDKDEFKIFVFGRDK